MIDWINEKTGMFAGWLTTLLVINVFYDTVMRYAFNKGNIALQELEWHIFSVIFFDRCGLYVKTRRPCESRYFLHQTHLQSQGLDRLHLHFYLLNSVLPAHHLFHQGFYFKLLGGR